MGITPKDPADFDPSMGDYKNLRPFRFWCQKVMPLVYDDSLSYYEVLCKLVDYLNKTMEDVGVLHEDVDALHTAYQQLQSYVNDYFSTLDVQQEINNKLDVMASDGTLDALLLPYFNAYKTAIDSDIANFKNTVNTSITTQDENITVLQQRMDTFASLTEGSTTGDAELADIRVGADGVTYPTAGDSVRGQYNKLKSIFENYGYYLISVSATWVRGFYTMLDGHFSDDTTTRCATSPTISVTAGETYRIFGDANKAYRVTFFDSNNVFINSLSNNEYITNIVEFTVPTNATQFGVTAKFTDESTMNTSDCNNIVIAKKYENEPLFADNYIFNKVTVYNPYNLFNENDFNHGYISDGGAIETAYGDNAIYTNFIPIDHSKSYTFKSDFTYLGLCFAWYDSDTLYISRNNYYPNTVNEQTVTPPNTAVYMKLSLLTTGLDEELPITKDFLVNSRTMLTESTYSNSTYVPYYGSSVDYIARNDLNNKFNSFDNLITKNLYNLFNENTFEYGYITAQGSIMSYDENAVYSSMIHIDNQKSYTFKADYSYLGVGFGWYDEEGTFISRTNFYPSTASEYTVEPPNDAVYMRICVLTDLTTIPTPVTPEFLRETMTTVCESDYATQPYVPYYGSAIDYLARSKSYSADNDYLNKTISILGDSISTYAGIDAEVDPDGHLIADGTYTYEGNHCRYPNAFLGDVNQTYWKKLINNLGMVLDVNDSWAGSRVSWDGSEGSDVGADKYIASPTRINHLGGNGNPDYILVNAGTNDIGNNVPVGTFNTENPVNYTDSQIANLPVNTFADAYRALLIRLQKKYPLARIVVMLPNYTTSYYNPTNADKYLEVIKEACDFFGVPWVDMRAVGVTMYNTNNYLGDGIHPNQRGMELLYNKLLKYFSYSL